MNPCKKICEKSSFYFPSNQLSTKRLQAQMIRANTKITYNNSRITTIYSNILTLNYETNKSMLIQYKYDCYMRYYTLLLRGNIPQSTRNALSQMLTTLLESLTEEEYNQVFQIKPSEPPMLPNMTNDSGYSFYVVTRNTRLKKFFIIKNMPPEFILKLYTFYTFDLSDPSNLNTKLCFSQYEYSATPYRGVFYTGIPGTPGSKMILNVYKDINAIKLFVFNDIQMYIPLKYDWGYSMPTLLTELYISKNPQIPKVYSYYYPRQNTYLSVYESTGPKYFVNNRIEPSLILGANPFTYAFTYGTYYFEISDFFTSTLLNKGYEDCVTFIGDPDKKSIVNVSNLNFSDYSIKEGEYTFYHGQVKMIVYKPFPFPMTIYSKEFGFMGGYELFHFTNEPKENKDTNIVDLKQNFINSIGVTTMIRFNEDGENNTKRKYGLQYGDYYISIQDDFPIAFMNKGKEDLLRVLPSSYNVVSGTFNAPDGTAYPFYTGDIILQVKDDFDRVSICTKNGYSGGYQLLVYNAYHGAPLPSLYKSRQGVSALRSQTTLFVKEDTTFSSFITFNDETTQKYGLYKGVYLIFNISRKSPITLLNKGKENLVTLESGTKNGTFEGIGPDGTPYTFYHGILKITVRGNFGFMSLFTLYNNYMGGYKMFSYDSFFDNQDSYPDPLSIPLITPVSDNTIFTEVKRADILTEFLSPFNTDLTIEYNAIWDYPDYNAHTLYVTNRASFENNLEGFLIRYYVANRIYILSCIDHYITILNKGKEAFIFLKGNLSRQAIASDGNEYTFYSGEMIALYVFSDFEIMTLEVLGGPVERGFFVHTIVI